jgi:hypothetical protein
LHSQNDHDRPGTALETVKKEWVPPAEGLERHVRKLEVFATLIRLIFP